MESRIVSRKTDLDFNKPSDQFLAEMEMENHPLSIVFGISLGVAVVMGQRDSRIVFLSPDMMRDIGADLIEMAGEWERGEIEGMEPRK